MHDGKSIILLLLELDFIFEELFLIETTKWSFFLKEELTLQTWLETC